MIRRKDKSNVLVNWSSLQRGDLVKRKHKKYLVIGFNALANMSKTAPPIIYCHRMLFGKYRIGKVVKIIIEDEPTWFEVLN